ncbi:hypothetical protein GCM10010517_77630 [Streptosporangium fragile]|uniref:Uncharacterized protein n=1 Tax=Streptosporangium fragile TaxID=46186 RepID=A0ABP6IVS4_9ACTN
MNRPGQADTRQIGPAPVRPDIDRHTGAGRTGNRRDVTAAVPERSKGVKNTEDPAGSAGSKRSEIDDRIAEASSTTPISGPADRAGGEDPGDGDLHRGRVRLPASSHAKSYRDIS